MILSRRASRSHIPTLARYVTIIAVTAYTIWLYLRCSAYVCHPLAHVALDPDDYREYDVDIHNLLFPQRNAKETPKKAIIAAAMKSENTSWIYENFPDWQKFVYHMDDPSAPLTVLRNKGRESSAYLTYIIDNYHKLPQVMIFSHGGRYQWHNEDPLWDGVNPIKNLRHEYVQKHGYANLRCTWELGCPHELEPRRTLSWYKAVTHPGDYRASLEFAYTQAFLEIFPDKRVEDVPDVIGVPCGAQFALSKDAVRARPLSEWVRIRDWLYQTKLDDQLSGRILEYTWHQIMGKPAVHCPSASSCFCEKFGFCELECPDQTRCEKRYINPSNPHFPARWPEVGPGTNGWPQRDWAS